MKRNFHWDLWNRAHIAKHSVSQSEAESVVLNAKPPYPRKIEKQKYLVRGKTSTGRFLQVIFVIYSDERIDYESISADNILNLADNDAPLTYVVHARDLNAGEKSQYRRMT